MMGSPQPMAVERNLILASLLLLAAAAWVVLVQQSAFAGGMMPGLTMGLGPALFLAIWVTMMVAMMFPTAAPMILTFAKIHEGKRQRGQAFVPTWVFVAAYLLVWTLFGGLAYGLALVAQGLAEGVPWLMENAPRIGGGAIALAAIYQFSPFKRVCLSKCRTPLHFIISSWRDGYLGTLVMGIQHGGYCLGCCWLLFVILFPLGMMNVAAMAAITLLIFAEKSLRWGQRIGQVAAAALLIYGMVVIAVPQLLPTFVGDGAMPMPERLQPMPDPAPMMPHGSMPNM